jgi:hypothetical protein
VSGRRRPFRRWMNSRWAGRCTRCSETYNVGDRILWTKGQGSLCLACGDGPRRKKQWEEAAEAAMTDAERRDRDAEIARKKEADRLAREKRERQARRKDLIGGWLAFAGVVAVVSMGFYAGLGGVSSSSGRSSDFCDTHSCIASFESGDGYPVECADGMWSQSGGIQGACSGHGGYADGEADEGSAPSAGIDSSDDYDSSSDYPSASDSPPSPPYVPDEPALSVIEDYGSKALATRTLQESGLTGDRVVTCEGSGSQTYWFCSVPSPVLGGVSWYTVHITPAGYRNYVTYGRNPEPNVYTFRVENYDKEMPEGLPELAAPTGGSTTSGGNGYAVTCADGTISHSGGIQGACSHHGGVR